MSVLAFDVKVPVSLFLQAPPLERAFQFITINNKSSKVPTNNIKACIANFDEFEINLKERLTAFASLGRGVILINALFMVRRDDIAVSRDTG